MHAERDYLRTHVFPELEERLRARRHYLNWVDLRLGVATDSEVAEGDREAQVLKHCLTEVQRCRPFLIVLLGDRYGWIPPADRIELAGLVQNAVGRSVTDLEIELGVLSDPGQQTRTLFYFRQPLPYAEMPAQTAALYSDSFSTDANAQDGVRGLALLKQRIKSKLPSRVRQYAAGWDRGRHQVTDLESFGRMVLKDLWAELAEETAQANGTLEVSWQQSERDALEDFADDRARDFVGREAIVSRIISHCLSPVQTNTSWGICLTGDPGSGKSALFGELFRRMKDTDAFVLAHAAGASPRASSVDAMLRRWSEEIASALNVTDVGLADNADAEKVEATFTALLGRMALQRRVVVLVDALDQFENTPRARFGTWIPAQWPKNARFIATAIAGDASKVLAQRLELEALSLPPMNETEARGIIKGICDRYHRKFETRVIDALLARTNGGAPAWGNPLWLVLAVEELNLLDADDFARIRGTYSGPPADRLRNLMLDIISVMPLDIPGLYAATYRRAGELFGAAVASAFLGLIAVSRAGWRESDFRQLLPRVSGEPWDELRFASLRRLFRGQLRQRGELAQWDFNHGQMRGPARSSLAVLELSEPQLHLLISNHLQTLALDDPLRVSETMIHLLASKDNARAAHYYGNPSLSEAEMRGATRVLVDAVTAAPTGDSLTAVRNLLHLLDDRLIDHSMQMLLAERLLFIVGGALEFGATLDARAVLVHGVKETFNRLLSTDSANPRLQRDLSSTHEAMADILTDKGELASARKEYEAQKNILNRVLSIDRADATARGMLAVVYNKLGHLLESQAKPADALDAFRNQLFICEALVRSDSANTISQNNLAGAYSSLGRIFAGQRKLSSAIESYEKSFSIYHHLAEADRENSTIKSNLAGAHEDLGSLEWEQHNVGAALERYRASIVIRESICRADPANSLHQRALAKARSQMGELLAEGGKPDQALKEYYTAVQIMEDLVKGDPSNANVKTEMSLLYALIGDSLIGQNKLTDGLKYYHTAIAILDELKIDPSNDAHQMKLFTLHYALIDTGEIPSPRFKPLLMRMRELKRQNRLTAPTARLLAHVESMRRRRAVAHWIRNPGIAVLLCHVGMRAIMTLFIACLVLYQLGMDWKWYAAAGVFWLLHIFFWVWWAGKISEPLKQLQKERNSESKN